MRILIVFIAVICTVICYACCAISGDGERAEDQAVTICGPKPTKE